MEEKKNTMENMTKALEVARTLPCACSDCGIRETESAKKILEFAESLSGSAENITKGQQFNLPAAAVFNLQQIALADDDMVKAPGAAEKYRFIARHILELFEASGSVAAPKEEKSEDFGKLKWKVGQILAEQFLKYNDGKFIAAIELNPATHALTEFIESENTALREALKELLTITETNVFNYNEYKAIIERARNLISK